MPTCRTFMHCLFAICLILSLMSNWADAQPLVMTIAYRFLDHDCNNIITYDILDDDWMIDTVATKALGINIILQLRPGPGAPEAIPPPESCVGCDSLYPRGIPFTIDLIDDAHFRGGGFQYDPVNGVISVNSLLFHVADMYRHISDSVDTSQSVQYDCNVGDTLFFDVVCRMEATATETTVCYCGQDRWAPGTRGDSHATWDYGRLVHWEVLDHDLTGGVTRPSALTSICRDLGTGADLCVTWPSGIAPGPGSDANGYSLSAALPNPFRTATTVRYVLPVATEIAITVNDIRGQAVRTLYRGQRESGSYLITWDGLDDAGREVVEGVYWIELRSDAVSTRSRVVRLR